MPNGENKQDIHSEDGAPYSTSHGRPHEAVGASEQCPSDRHGCTLGGLPSHKAKDLQVT